MVKSGSTVYLICVRDLQALMMHGVSCVTRFYPAVQCFLQHFVGILKLLTGMYSQRHIFFFRRKLEASQTRERSFENGQSKRNPALLYGLRLLERLIELLEF
jgi:hypothetical protein